MKKNLLAVLLPVVAGVALSGTGFGLWVFHEAVDNKFVGASMQVEPAINFEKTALSIESLSVTNKNEKSVDGKTIVFDQSDALASGDRWTVEIKVGVTYKALLGVLHAESNITDGLGGYSASSTVGDYKVFELKEKLALYQVTVYSPLSTTTPDAGCTISDYLTSSADLTVRLDNFDTDVPTADGSFANEGDATKIANTFTFTFTPSQKYKDIDTAGEYTTFLDLVKTSTFNFTAEFKKVTA